MFNGGAVVRRAVHVLIAIATIEVAATLLLLPRGLATWLLGVYSLLKATQA